MTDDRYRALSFDCYGTLIDWETGIAAELVPCAERHGIAAGLHGAGIVCQTRSLD